MADIQQDGIEVHDNSLKNPEKPLILEDWANLVAATIDIETRGAEIFHRPVDRAHSNEGATAIQHVQGPLDLAVQDTTTMTIVVESGSQGNKGSHKHKLQDQSCFKQSLSCLSLAFRRLRVGNQRSPVAGDSFDHNTNRHKSGENAPRMNWRMVWDVVKDAAQSEVVGALIDGSVRQSVAFIINPHQ